MFLRAGIVLGLFTLTSFVAADPPQDDQVVTRILLGSCIKQDRPTPIFQTMLSAPADLALFLGDNIYADTDDMNVMRAKYQRLADNPGFQGIRSAMPILATWDDHDYGVNDGGADYPKRDLAQQAFLDFWQAPSDSPRRSRRGVYDARIIGPKGRRLQVILLDTRYFRSALKKGERRVGGPYYPDSDPNKTMLGDEQWQWLQQQLRQPAELRLIASSIQCVAEAAGQETWSNLPLERARLFRLIQQTSARGVFIVSGDRHWSELSVKRDDVPYPIYDLTCSSLNQIHARGTPTQNSYRADPTTFHRENYGVIHIDWSDDPTITLEIRDIEAGVRISKRIRSSELSP